MICELRWRKSSGIIRLIWALRLRREAVFRVRRYCECDGLEFKSTGRPRVKVKTQPIVSLNNVSKRYMLQHERTRSVQEILVGMFKLRRARREEFWALRDVSFDVQPGESIGLIGPNGSGKSTTLKLISRILEPTSGQISVHGTVGGLLELGAGFHPDLTGRENVYLSGAILGFKQADIRKRLDQIVDFAGIDHFIDVPVRLYSSGMFVRLGFSVIVHLETEIMLIDEVLAVGDASFRFRCFQTLQTMQEEGRTFILVSHDFNAIRRMCSRVIMFNKGRIQMEGATNDVIRVAVEAQNRERALSDSSTAGTSQLPSRLDLNRSENSAVIDSALAGGWYELEDTHCWTMRRAQLHMRVPEQASDFCLEIASMRPKNGRQHLPVKITINDIEPETIYVSGPNFQTVNVKIPAGVRGHTAHIALEVERTMVPDFYHHNGDLRELGIAVSRVWME